VVEGANDISFLERISGILARGDPSIPDLGALNRIGRLVFIPFGGGSPLPWVTRLAPLACPELHLYDREIPPEDIARRLAAALVNDRPHCAAFLTASRALENYLHARAISDAAGFTMPCFPNDADVPSLVAQCWYERRSLNPWTSLSRFERSKLTQRSKRWLNRTAVTHMTPALLAESDPDGDVGLWLRTAATLIQPCRAAPPECALDGTADPARNCSRPPQG